MEAATDPGADYQRERGDHRRRQQLDWEGGLRRICTGFPFYALVGTKAKTGS